jgi:hypothetical protein
MAAMTSGWATLALYCIAGAAYITLSVFIPEAILSWVQGAAFLAVTVALIPLLVSRFR